jgi:hypothetical protein
MTYDEIHPAMCEALGAFEMLRRFGFASADIFFHQNAAEPPGGPEPRGMMFVVLQTQGKEFSIRVGVVDTTYEAWRSAWGAVATAAAEKQIEAADRIVTESEAFRLKIPLMLAIQAKGIRVPAMGKHLS